MAFFPFQCHFKVECPGIIGPGELGDPTRPVEVCGPGAGAEAGRGQQRGTAVLGSEPDFTSSCGK